MYFVVKSQTNGLGGFSELRCKLTFQRFHKWEVVVAQLAEWSLTIPEDPGSIPVIGNFY